MILPALAVVAVVAGGDPRPEIVRLQLEAQHTETLAFVEQQLAADPANAHVQGLDYLRGHLLEQLARTREAHEAFADAMGGAPALKGYSRYRLARNQLLRGHPEVAAGLLATLLAGEPPEALVPSAVAMLVDSIARGGDCRLLRDYLRWPLPELSLRRLAVSRAACDHKSGSTQQAVDSLVALLEEDTGDETARHAALLLDRWTSIQSGTAALHQLLLGQAFHRQRQFDLSISYLRQGLASAKIVDSATLDGEEYEAVYALARGYFWQQDYLQAAKLFGRLASRSGEARQAVQALYQQGRSFELHGLLEAAGHSFRLAYQRDPNGRWASAALISALRIEWRRGRETDALTLLTTLASRREWGELHGRAALFLAGSDLAQGRTDRAPEWLEAASRASRNLRPLVAYWQGRLAELQSDHEEALARYLEVLRDNPYHPLGQLARRRIQQAPLAAEALQIAARYGSGGDVSRLYDAWLLLPDEAPDRQRVGRAIVERFLSTANGRPYFAVDFRPPSDWPLWNRTLNRPEEMLLALGIWEEGGEVYARHFPLQDQSLAFTRSRLLSRGGRHREALRVAATLHEGAASVLPVPFIPPAIRRAAYPLLFGTLIGSQAAQRRIDPFLLTALIREESGFDPQAVSAAAARGLTQFVPLTARRLAPQIGIDRLSVEDLHRPEIAVALGAVYLQELLERYDGHEIAAIAAYNAGEAQADLWRAYCATDDPAEYFTKVGFPETRRYLERVFSSRAHYRDLYPAETLAPADN